MSRVLDQPEAPVTPEHVAIYRSDYLPPDWLVPDVSLEFELDPERTRGHSTLTVARNGDHDRPLKLAGNGLQPLSIRVDNGDAPWTMVGETLVVELPGDSATIEIAVEITPWANTKLMGLYASGGTLG